MCTSVPVYSFSVGEGDKSQGDMCIVSEERLAPSRTSVYSGVWGGVCLRPSKDWPQWPEFDSEIWYQNSCTGPNRFR